MIYLAHVQKNSDGTWRTQPLEEHLKNTAEIAENFARECGCKGWGCIAGYLHDLGKLDMNWQKYLRQTSGYDTQEVSPFNHPNHSTHGALQAFMDLSDKSAGISALALSYAIAGHHAGLPDFTDSGSGSLHQRLSEAASEKLLNKLENSVKNDKNAQQLLHAPYPVPDNIMGLPIAEAESKSGKNSDSFHMWVRMLFSCLCDADFLDTESFMNPQEAELRGGYAGIPELRAEFRAYMKKLTQNAPQTTVNICRKKVLEDCLIAAEKAPGFYTLTVPTGGGKTFASLAFALKHAELHNKRRVIIAIPFTSIIEQTAKDIREALGPRLKKNVLEHHSNLDPARTDGYDEDIKEKLRLSTENWDAPLIVTTNVQLFESLLGARTSRCRKLHNIANSVIILDEAQTLPPNHLRAIISTLKTLVKHFGVTVVLCTATQPALGGPFKLERGEIFNGITEAEEIIRSGPELFSALKRVTRIPKYDINTPVDWKTLAHDIAEDQRVLAVVNTRDAARQLYEALKKYPCDNLFHLSASMCPSHRSDVIDKIKKLMKQDGTGVRVVSTQLIEAGVNLDFPIVYRAMCGLDSAVQAAGRCNREGKLQGYGRLILFTPEKPSPPGLLRKGEQNLRRLLAADKDLNIFDAKVIHTYFNNYYADVNSVDEGSLFKRDMLKNASDFNFAFRDFAENFSFIDNQKQINLFVPYINAETGADGQKLIRELLSTGPARDLMRRLQRYSVTLPEQQAQEMINHGLIAATEDNAFYYLVNPSSYDKNLGVIPQISTP